MAEKKVKKEREYTIIKEAEPPKNTDNTLIDHETILISFKTSKGFIFFTDKRIVLSSTEKKKLVYTIPYKSIDMYSSHSAKGLRDQGGLDIWTKSATFSFKLKKSIDIQSLERIIATYTL